MPVVALGALAAALGLFARAADVPSAQGGGAVAGEPACEQLAEGLPDAPETDARAQGLAEGLLKDADSRCAASELGVPEASAEVLGGYAARADCVLRQAGYLGLFGDSWCCVVLGGDWSEVCVVSAKDEGSEVRTWRIGAEDVEGLLSP